MRVFQVVLRSLLTLVLVLGTVCVAVSAPTPKGTLEVTVNQILDVLKNPAYADPVTRPALRVKIEGLVEYVFDFKEFSTRTVGSRWGEFSADQQARFNEAFARLLLSTYLNRITGYNGEKIDFSGETLSEKGDRAEVVTVVTLADGKRVPVAYRMMLKNDAWVVYDVLIENISLIKNYRSQFNDILAKGTPDDLIGRVLERAKAI